MNTLTRYGLFDASVPRYTSYPPANHFVSDVGRKNQKAWLNAVGNDEVLSLYVHIPFCRRLCWFCACRTQGTKTLAPVESYVQTLRQELARVRAELPSSVKVSRLHLGGGTPTLLSVRLMKDLLDDITRLFPAQDDWEFSVEIDPTEASHDILRLLAAYGLNRASIGVQDFSPKVQQAIGRQQSFDETNAVIQTLRAMGVKSINLDLLYGLPWQSHQSFSKTMDQVMTLGPDRMAIYGYAHVPWMSKRQVMIPATALPDTRMRYEMAQSAQTICEQQGFVAVGIDHFAKPQDGLARALETRTLRRNFQGYSDEPGTTLLAFGASGISRFRDGYCQNAVSTRAYQNRISSGVLAGDKGFEFLLEHQLKARMIENLMCYFSLNARTLETEFPDHRAVIRDTSVTLAKQFSGAVSIGPEGIEILPDYRPLARIMAHEIDSFLTDQGAHSAAI